MVETLIEFAKSDRAKELEDGVEVASQMLRMPNKEGNTALHEAALHGHRDVVKKLIREDTSLLCLPNSSEETPLYIATERLKKSVFNEICSYPNIDKYDEAYQGPSGKTALHAAFRRRKPGKLILFSNGIINIL